MIVGIDYYNTLSAYPRQFDLTEVTINSERQYQKNLYHFSSVVYL